MKPIFSIIADGENVTDRVSNRMLDLRINDEAGLEADRLAITLDDRDAELRVPPHQSKVQVSLGISGGRYPVPLTEMGVWQVDETELTGPNRKMRITATAADMSGPIRSPRTEAWENTTIDAIVRTIAARVGLTPVIDDKLGSVSIPYEAQVGESDMNFLTRLALRYSGIAKPAAERLLFVRKGGLREPSGTLLAPGVVPADQASKWTWRASDRGVYASVEASWTDLGNGQVRKIIVGDGEPRRVIRQVFSSEDEARRAALSSFERSAHGGETLSIKLAYFRPDLFAGGPLTFSETRQELGGTWAIKTVIHTMTNKLVTEVTAERPNPE